MPSSLKNDAVAAPENSSGPSRWWRSLRALHERERGRLREEIARIPGLMPLLMKPRNGHGWSKKERLELRQRLRGLSRVSLYLALAALPFTSLTLPVIAWWLDRRARPRTPMPGR